MLNNLPKPLIIGVAVVAVLLALIIISKTVLGPGENDGRPTKEDLQKAQSQNSASPTGGRTQP